MSDEKGFVKIGDSKYRIAKSGRAQAAQVLKLTRWLTKYGTKALGGIDPDEEINGIQLISEIVGNLDEDALIDFFGVVTGCTEEEAEVYFDIATLIDVAVELWETQPSIGRLIDRFFSNTTSTESTENSATISE